MLQFCHLCMLGNDLLIALDIILAAFAGAIALLCDCELAWLWNEEASPSR